MTNEGAEKAIQKRNEDIALTLYELISLRAQALAEKAKSLENSFAETKDEIEGLQPKEGKER